MRGLLVLKTIYKSTAVCATLLLVSVSFADVIDGEDLVDPTRPLTSVSDNGGVDLGAVYRSMVPASFDISFIRASSSNPIAVINGQQVTIGDVIGAASVLSIDRSSVTLLIDGQEQIVSLYKTNVKGAALTP